MATASVAIDNTREDPGVRAPLVTGGHDYASVTDTVCTIAERPKPPLAWYVAFGVSLSLMGMFFALIGYLISFGSDPGRRKVLLWSKRPWSNTPYAQDGHFRRINDRRKGINPKSTQICNGKCS